MRIEVVYMDMHSMYLFTYFSLYPHITLNHYKTVRILESEDLGLIKQEEKIKIIWVGLLTSYFTSCVTWGELNFLQFVP